MNRHGLGMPKQERARGFTLIELMIVVVVVGILGAIAYPSYLKSVMKGRRSSAQTHLMEIAQQQQQYLVDARSYAPSVSALNLTTPANVLAYYTVAITITSGPPPTFTATATPIAGSSQASDGPLSIDSTGAKTPSTSW